MGQYFNSKIKGLKKIRCMIPGYSNVIIYLFTGNVSQMVQKIKTRIITMKKEMLIILALLFPVLGEKVFGIS